MNYIYHHQACRRRCSGGSICNSGSKVLIEKTLSKHVLLLFFLDHDLASESLINKCFPPSPLFVKAPQHCTKGWRKFLKLKSLARPFLRFEVGDDSNISLLHDNWHPLGVLYTRFGHMVVYDAAHCMEAKVSSMHQEEWQRLMI